MKKKTIQHSNLNTYMINGGGVSRRGISLIRLKDIVGGTLAVVAPPLCPFGRVIGPFAQTSRVRGVFLRDGPVVHRGKCSITHQRRFCGINKPNYQ